jgi:hypothetical protein
MPSVLLVKFRGNAMTLVYEKRLEGARLPENYLPMALNPRSIQTGYIPVFSGHASSSDPLEKAPFALKAKKISDPNYVARKLGKLADQDYVRLGAHAAQKGNPAPCALVHTGSVSGKALDAIGIIDLGIAFWNPRFMNGSRSQFQDVGFLNPLGQNAYTSFLGTREVNRLAHLASARFGERQLIDTLGARYPFSCYGDDPLVERIYRPSAFNHGTAMADLAAPKGGNMATGVQGHPALFGLELPASVLLDSSGGALQTVLGIAIRELAVRIMNWAADQGRPANMRFVLSFAFLGGPDEGTHPLLKRLKRQLKWVQKQGSKIKLFVPTGNHRQDQLHAILDHQTARRKTNVIEWFLPPSDTVPNTVETVCKALPSLTLHLRSPQQDDVQIPLKPNTYGVILNNAQEIGAVHVLPLGNGQLKVILSLAGGSQTSGAWSIAFNASSAIGEIKLWVQREDQLPFTRRSAPSRQSYFRDASYRIRDENGAFILGDTPEDKIRRLGSASLLATEKDKRIKTVTALEILNADNAAKEAFYAGALSSNKRVKPVVVDEGRVGQGQWALANGSARNFRVSGTSVAAALAARF